MAETYFRLSVFLSCSNLFHCLLNFFYSSGKRENGEAVSRFLFEASKDTLSYLYASIIPKSHITQQLLRLFQWFRTVPCPATAPTPRFISEPVLSMSGDYEHPPPTLLDLTLTFIASLLPFQGLYNRLFRYSYGAIPLRLPALPEFQKRLARAWCH